MSAPTYFGCVALITAVMLAVLGLCNPSSMRRGEEWVGLESPSRSTANSFYAIRIDPIFAEHCTGCHGVQRQKGKLRLDSFSELTHGSKHGPIVTAGQLKQSELWSRITLPVSDDKAMPPDGKPRLSADELTVIKLWIAAGASGTLSLQSIKGAPPPVLEAKFPDRDPAIVERERAPLFAAAHELQARFPTLIAYESRDSAEFQVDASLFGALFGDQQLAVLAPLKDHIIWMDLSGTSITDASAPVIKGMRQLRILRLSKTKVTERLVETLTDMPALKVLVIVGTPVEDKSLNVLRRKGVRVYDDNGLQDFIRGNS